MFTDVNLAFRQLVLSPRFTIVAILSSTINVGANIALCNLLDWGHQRGRTRNAAISILPQKIATTDTRV